MSAPTTRRLVVTDANGTTLVDQTLPPRTIALADSAEADIRLNALGNTTVFLAAADDLPMLGEPASDNEIPLELGQWHEAWGLRWLLTQGEAGREHSTGSFLTAALRWAERPLDDANTLRQALSEFLAMTRHHSGAQNGMLVVCERNGFALVAAENLDPDAAAKLWENLPATLAADVLREGARILLPEGLQRSGASSDSTVFIRGVKSAVGFPVTAEGELVAVFYLGFDNLLLELTQELQIALESVAVLLGLVLQRAKFRVQTRALALKADATLAAAPLREDRLMIGTSEKLANVYSMIDRLAPVDVPTLILGETGTGKELTAKEMHRQSRRCRHPFVVVNAAALPEGLLESELFGHRKGAFTGALGDRIGLVEQAHRGTLFIDEIGELPPSVQAKLLRVLQERSVTRLGEGTSRPVDFRLIVATHRDLKMMVRQETFREDLYYRIAGAVITIPPLRERRDDIVALATHFKSHFAAKHRLPDKEWSTAAIHALESAPWPGNIRELQNVVARAFVMARSATIQATDLGLEGMRTVDEPAEEPSFGVKPLGEAREAWMREFLARALRAHNGRRAETAKALGIGERTLFRYIEQLAIRDT